MLRRIRQLLELIRFSHTLFALPFALLAAVMAWAANRHCVPPRPFRWLDLLGILLCMATARSAAMAFNRLADRRLDALNPRTRQRHLPTGRLSVAAAAAFTAACSLGFVAGTLLFLPNRIPLYASVPVLLFLFAYSYAKRFTILSHFWLGAALMLAPLAAWVAIRGEIAWPPLVLGGAVLLWVAGFDMIYACQDVEFDVRMRLRSVPARFGVAAALRLAALCHAGHGRAVGRVAAGLSRIRRRLPGRRGRHGGAAGLRTLVGPARRPVPRQSGLLSGQRVVSIGLLVVGTIDLLL